jgi:hypothetical protein
MVALILLVSINVFSAETLDASTQLAFAGLLIVLVVIATSWSLYHGVLALHQRKKRSMKSDTSVKVEVQVAKSTLTVPLPASTLSF